MDANPYEPPRAEAALQPSSPTGAVPNKLRIPATALIALAGVSVVICLLGIVMVCSMIVLSLAGMIFDLDRGERFPSVLLMLSYSTLLIPNALVSYGAQQARRATSYRWALAAAIISIIPILSPFGYLGIPFGIWMLIVLLRKDVKACFEHAPAAARK